MAMSNHASAEEKAKELDNERLTLWQKTYEMVRKHPGGVGMGNWQVYFPDATLKGLWRAEDLNFTFQRPHNDLLWILSETGWPGLNLFLIFIFSLFLFLFRAVRFSQASEHMKIKMILCVAFIAAFLAASFFDFPKERIEHIVWLNIIFGIAYVYIQRYSDIKIFKKTVLPPFFVLLSFSILILIVGIGLLRYKGEYYTRLMYNERFLNQEAKAIIDGEEAVSFAYCLDPTSVPVHWYMANSYVNLKNYEKAQTDFILAYKENPYNRNVLNDLGSSYSFSNDDSLAKVCYREALRISPRFDDPKLNLAAIYIKEKKFREADTCLKLMFHDSERRSQYQKLVDAFK
jgi:tetratricopeptide (TPR) repeat protein